MTQTLAHPIRSGLKKTTLTPNTRARDRDDAAARQAWAAGVALTREHRDDQALPHLQRATTLAPEVALYWLNRAGAERRLRRTDEAIDSARRAFDLDRKSLLACQMLTELLRTNNRVAEAMQALRALDPSVERDAQHALLVGAVEMALGDWSAAAQSFLQVLAEQPAHIEAYIQLGLALANLRRFNEAAECFRTVTLLEPAEIGAATYAAHYAAWACDWQEGPNDLNRMVHSLALQPGRSDPPSFSPFCLLSMFDDPAVHLQAARLEASRVATQVRRLAGWQPPAAGAAGHPQAAAALEAGRIRVGFVSADFRAHATSILLVRVLEQLDRSRFELVLYSHGPDDGSALRARTMAAGDRFVDCSEMSVVEQAARIRADGVVLLVDLCGYTAHSRLGVFALRPAPVQASWLAYPGSTGADYIDFVIGDPVVTPTEHAADFSESIVQLPHSYQPTDDRREHPGPRSRKACGLPEAAFVFASFNQSYKLTEPVFASWCRILMQVPGSVLWLLVPQIEVQAALRREAQARGVDGARLVFAPFADQSDHLARLPQADLFLDTFPYGAHTTCTDALWMGVPVLTRAGRSFASRVAASLLHAAGLPELVFDDVEDYERRAVELATNARAELTRCRQHLIDRRRDLPLFDSACMAKGLGMAFERMVAGWDVGPTSAGGN